jgi:F-type H+-transporting ATPase subunit a
VQISGVVAHGVGGYLKELLTPIPLAPIHIIGEFSRLISLSARLFGNIFGGEVLVTVMYHLTFVVIPVIFISLELLFGYIQAMIFSMLTMSYIILAVAGHGGDHEEHEEHGAAALVAEETGAHM